MRRPFTLSAIAVALIVCQPDRPVRARAPADLPRAETVLDQFIEATGGKAAYEKLRNRTARGTIEIVGTDMKGTVAIKQARPNLAVIVTDLGHPMGKTTQGCRGRSAWSLSETMGDRLLEGEEKDDFIRHATFNNHLHWRQLYEKAECTGIEDVDGKPAYKVVLTPRTGKPVTRFFDKASHLLVKDVSTYTTDAGEIEVQAFHGDYRKLDGVLVSFTAKQKYLDQQIVYRFAEIKHNVEMPASTFKPPALPDTPEKKEVDILKAD